MTDGHDAAPRFTPIFPNDVPAEQFEWFALRQITMCNQ